MKFLRDITIVTSLGTFALLSACSRGGDPAWAASLDAVGQQFQLIRQAHAQQAAPASVEAQATYRNMQSLWERMNRTRSGMMSGGGMMRGGGMMGSPAMMRFNEMNQQMLSYCMGMQQMMRQAGHMDMAAMYGQMTEGMKKVLAELPEKSGGGSAPQPESAAIDGAATFAANCASCHGPDGAGVSGVFPPLNGSSLVTGDPKVLARIALQGLQGPITVAGTQYSGFMPAFENTLSDAQIAAALTYARSLPKNGAGAVDAGTIGNIRQQTTSRGQAWTANELGLH